MRLGTSSGGKRRPIRYGGPTEILRKPQSTGAYGIAFLLIRDLTGLGVIERSRKGTGFDYWLGHAGDDLPFQNKARLEVSGIRQGDAARQAARMSRKTKQTERSDGVLPAYVIVVEFGTPTALVVRR